MFVRGVGLTLIDSCDFLHLVEGEDSLRLLKRAVSLQGISRPCRGFVLGLMLR